MKAVLCSAAALGVGSHMKHYVLSESALSLLNALALLADLPISIINQFPSPDCPSHRLIIPRSLGTMKQETALSHEANFAESLRFSEDTKRLSHCRLKSRNHTSDD